MAQASGGGAGAGAPSGPLCSGRTGREPSTACPAHHCVVHARLLCARGRPNGAAAQHGGWVRVAKEAQGKLRAGASSASRKVHVCVRVCLCVVWLMHSMHNSAACPPLCSASTTACASAVFDNHHCLCTCCVLQAPLLVRVLCSTSTTACARAVFYKRHCLCACCVLRAPLLVRVLCSTSTTACARAVFYKHHCLCTCCVLQAQLLVRVLCSASTTACARAVFYKHHCLCT